MNKNIRILLVVLALIAIVVIAGSKTVWSKPGPNSPVAQTDAVSANAPLSVDANVGSVDPPNCTGSVTISGSESKSMCGEATLTGLGNVDVIATQRGREGDFISKTISLVFTKGSARLCFAAPNGGDIYFKANSSNAWTTFPTTIADGIACAVVSDSGAYCFGK
jgi:hypothetical protein